MLGPLQGGPTQAFLRATRVPLHRGRQPQPCDKLEAGECGAGRSSPVCQRPGLSFPSPNLGDPSIQRDCTSWCPQSLSQALYAGPGLCLAVRFKIPSEVGVRVWVSSGTGVRVRLNLMGLRGQPVFPVGVQSGSTVGIQFGVMLSWGRSGFGVEAQTSVRVGTWRVEQSPGVRPLEAQVC